MRKILISLLLVLFILPTVLSENRIKIDLKINSGYDDAYERNGNMYISDVTIDMGKQSTTLYRGGFRFVNIPLPKGAIIEDAKLSLAYNWASASTNNIILYGEASDNALQFTTTSKNISNRIKTSANVKLSNLNKVSWGQYQTSSNISQIIQEIINRANWKEGNSIVMLGYESSNSIWEAVSYEGTSWNYGLYGAKLQITASIPSVCVGNWQCTSWSECSGGTQTRTCTDLNNCGTNISKPIETLNCTVNLCKDIICNDSELLCPDGFTATCENNCNNNTKSCSNCTPDCAGHKNLCTGIVCQNSELKCPDGFTATCENFCNEFTGQCSSCMPNCEGHQGIEYKEVTYTAKITSNNDDTYEKSNNMYLNGATIDIGNGYYGGFRFVNIPLPKGAIIEDAKLSLAYNWASSSASNIILYGENSDNARQFQSISKDITNRARTKGITWTNLVKGSWGAYQTSPNISQIIQEIINRTNWKNGSSIAILGYYLSGGMWEAVSYEGTDWNYGLYSAKLEIKALIPTIPINNTNTTPPSNNQSNNTNTSKIVIIQMDDASPQWGQDITIEVVQSFIDNQIDLVIDLFPSGLTTNIPYADKVRIWQSSPYIEVGQGTEEATGSFSYSGLVNNLNNGAAEFANAGLKKPKTVTCHISNGDTNTLNAIRDTGYNSFACLLEGPYRDINPLTIGSGYGNERHGEFILRDFGAMGTNQPIKTANEFRVAADAMIAKRGYAYFVGHFSDYTTDRIKYLIDQLNILRNEGYVFITATNNTNNTNTTPPTPYNSTGIILVQLDDTSPEQLDTANLAVEKFHNERIAITPELWPAGLSNSNLKNIALLWDSWPEVEIAQGIYSGSSPSKSYSSMVTDLQLGKAEYATVGVTQPTSYLPHMGYPTSGGLDALRYEGFLVVIDYVSPDRVRSGNSSNPSEMPLTIYDGRDIAEGGLDNYDTVLSSVQSQVAAKGYADLAFHVWAIDEPMSNNVITMMKRLRDEEGYTFMTATEYYYSIWGKLYQLKK